MNDYHGFENTGDEPVFMIWGYAGAASLDEAGYIRYVDDRQLTPATTPASTRILPLARRSASGRRPSSTSASSAIGGPAVTAATSLVGEQVERGRDVGVADVRDRRDDVDLAQDHRREVELPRRAVQADEQHPAAAARAGDRRGGRVRGAAGLDHHVEADAPLTARAAARARSRPAASAVSVAPSARRRRQPPVRRRRSRRPPDRRRSGRRRPR